ncbi:hypothetical protein [Paenibacillus sp. V4I7]|uniref:hypothetical protein n=1 Tax=Paenibacillus sp. V4I7 TaxID=3042307 RepID=UPI0027852E7E|nr:hypothetical protein [Paenibacillus sp. V4I7]MDQ0899914.1 hypothetical protein [Paenibacillus sp. V4I7]
MGKVTVEFEITGTSEKEGLFVNIIKIKEFPSESTLGELEQTVKEMIQDIENKYENTKTDFFKIVIRGMKTPKGITYPKK